MAIVQCPNCNESISSRHKACPHCKTVMGELSAEELAAIAAKNRVKQQQRLLNWSFVALILFLGGFFYLYWRMPAQGSLEHLLGRAAVFIGCAWYLVNRVILVYLKKKK